MKHQYIILFGYFLLFSANHSNAQNKPVLLEDSIPYKCVDYFGSSQLHVKFINTLTEINIPNYNNEESNGALLRADKGNFTELSPKESGFFVNSDCKDMISIQFDKKTILITVSNQSKANTFKLIQ